MKAVLLAKKKKGWLPTTRISTVATNQITGDPLTSQVDHNVTSVKSVVMLQLTATKGYVTAVREKVMMLKLVLPERMACPRSLLRRVKDPDDYMIAKLKDKSS